MDNQPAPCRCGHHPHRRPRLISPAARGKQTLTICHNRSDRFCHSASPQQSSCSPLFLVVACRPSGVRGRPRPLSARHLAVIRLQSFSLFYKTSKMTRRNRHRSTPSAKTTHPLPPTFCIMSQPAVHPAPRLQDISRSVLNRQLLGQKDFREIF